MRISGCFYSYFSRVMQSFMNVYWGSSPLVLPKPENTPIMEWSFQERSLLEILIAVFGKLESSSTLVKLFRWSWTEKWWSRSNCLWLVYFSGFVWGSIWAGCSDVQNSLQCQHCFAGYEDSRVPYDFFKHVYSTRACFFLSQYVKCLCL